MLAIIRGLEVFIRGDAVQVQNLDGSQELRIFSESTKIE